MSSWFETFRKISWPDSIHSGAVANRLNSANRSTQQSSSQAIGTIAPNGEGAKENDATSVAMLDAARHQLDRVLRRGYDYDCTAPSHRDFLRRTGQWCTCLNLRHQAQDPADYSRARMFAREAEAAGNDLIDHLQLAAPDLLAHRGGPSLIDQLRQKNATLAPREFGLCEICGDAASLIVPWSVNGARQFCGACFRTIPTEEFAAAQVANIKAEEADLDWLLGAAAIDESAEQPAEPESLRDPPCGLCGRPSKNYVPEPYSGIHNFCDDCYQAELTSYVHREISRIEAQALALGWPRPRLWNESFWDRPRGLITVMGLGDIVTDVDPAFITIKKNDIASTRQRFPKTVSTKVAVLSGIGGPVEK